MANKKNMLTDWTFKTTHVQPHDVLDGDGSLKSFVSAESVVLAAGPAAYPAAGFGDLSSIGLCDSASVQQNRNLVQIFELGSKLPYIFPGRTFIQLTLTKVVFNGDSLLGALTYSLESPTPSDSDSTDLPGYPAAEDTGSDTSQVTGNFYLNLASSFFNKSFGLGIFIQDSDTALNTGVGGQGQWVSGVYAENCMIQNHQMALQGQQYIVMENAVIRCTNLRPIDVRADVSVGP
jgi:hypothetical protein